MANISMDVLDKLAKEAGLAGYIQKDKYNVLLAALQQAQGVVQKPISLKPTIAWLPRKNADETISIEYFDNVKKN